MQMVSQSDLRFILFLYLVCRLPGHHPLLLPDMMTRLPPPPCQLKNHDGCDPDQSVYQSLEETFQGENIFPEKCFKILTVDINLTLVSTSTFSSDSYFHLLREISVLPRSVLYSQPRAGDLHWKTIQQNGVLVWLESSACLE